VRVRLNLVHLLLIGPTFLVVLIALASTRVPYYYWSVAYKEANRLQTSVQMLHKVDLAGEVDLASATDSAYRKISQQTIGFWLNGSFGDTHPILGECPEKDPWGRPYQCTTRSIGGEDRLSIYSLGRDGTSKSNGNDQDDLNSWNDDSLKWYRRVDDRREKIDILVQGSIITALIYVVFLLIKGTAAAERKRQGFN